MEINNNLCDTSYRTKIWKMVYKKEKETLDMDMDEIHILKNILCRLIKVYELVVIFSSLTCGALIGISHTNNNISQAGWEYAAREMDMREGRLGDEFNC